MSDTIMVIRSTIDTNMPIIATIDTVDAKNLNDFKQVYIISIIRLIGKTHTFCWIYNTSNGYKLRENNIHRRKTQGRATPHATVCRVGPRREYYPYPIYDKGPKTCSLFHILGYNRLCRDGREPGELTSSGSFGESR